MMDPESPQKQHGGFNYDYKNDDFKVGEDPWYSNSNSGQVSPQSEPGGNQFNFGMYGQNNAANNQYVNPVQAFDAAVEDYDNEPPLLEELGINFQHILTKTQAVLYPIKPLSEHILDDADLAGPVCFCLLLGSCLLLSGKVQFGYIYGFSVFGCLGMNGIINLMHPVGLDVWRTCSVLGYCLIPVIALAAIAIVVNLKGWLGLILSTIAIVWATGAATRMFEAKLGLTDQYWLVAYPIMLMYLCFVIITIF